MFKMADSNSTPRRGAVLPGIHQLKKVISLRYGNLKLREKYLFSHVMTVLLTVLVLSTASYYITRTQVEKRATEFSSTFLQKAAFIWETKVDEIIDYFLIQLDSVDIGSHLKAGLEVDRNLTRIRVEKILADVITYKTGINFMLIETPDGQRYFRMRDGQRFTIGEIQAVIPYSYVQALRARPVFQTMENGTILLSKVMYDLKTSEYLGILSVGFSQETFSIIFPETNSPVLGTLMIVDDRWGRPVLVSPGGENLLLGYRIEAGRRQKIDGLSFLVDEVVTHDNRWRLLTYTSISDLARLSLSAELYIVMAAALALAAAILLSFVLSRRESGRILRIKEYANQIVSGNLRGHSTDRHADELGQLSQTIEDLSNRIAALVEGLASEKARLSEIRYSALQFEYSALQSKINPHFLYNTLEMINALAKVNGDTEISTVIQMLGDLMRSSLRATKRLIPLEEELAYIQKYLNIQHLLHDEKLETRMEIPACFQNILVPNFILQPIVENAIAHGIDPLRGQGIIVISARESAGALVISVKDNGVGMDKETVCSVLNREIKEDKVHTKMGLANVNRRIRIVYGSGSGVNIDSTPGEGTCVSITLPIRTEFWE